MKTTLHLRNLPQRIRDWIIPFLLLVIWLTLVTFGTISIYYERNSASQSLSIQLSELMKLMNKSMGPSVHIICKEEPQTYVPSLLQTCRNYGLYSSYSPVRRKYYMIPSYMLHSKKIDYGNLYSSYYPIKSQVKSWSLFYGRFPKTPVDEFRKKATVDSDE